MKDVFAGAALGAAMFMAVGWGVSGMGAQCSLLCRLDVLAVLGAAAGAWGGWSASSGR